MTLKNKKIYPGFKFDVILNKLQNLGCAVHINLEDHITSAGLCLNYFIRKVSRHALEFLEILNMIFPPFLFSFLSRNNIGVLFLQFWLFSGLGWSFIWASVGCGSLEPMFKGCNYYSWVGSSRTGILHECLHQRFVEGEEPDLPCPADTQIKCSLNALSPKLNPPLRMPISLRWIKSLTVLYLFQLSACGSFWRCSGIIWLSGCFSWLWDVHFHSCLGFSVCSLVHAQKIWSLLWRNDINTKPFPLLNALEIL